MNIRWWLIITSFIVFCIFLIYLFSTYSLFQCNKGHPNQNETWKITANFLKLFQEMINHIEEISPLIDSIVRNTFKTMVRCHSIDLTIKIFYLWQSESIIRLRWSAIFRVWALNYMQDAGRDLRRERQLEPGHNLYRSNEHFNAWIFMSWFI